MKNLKSWLPFALLTMILCCTATCSPAYAQTGDDHGDKIEVVEKLPDGSYILTINGTKFRAILPEQIRDIQGAKINLESCTESNQNLTAQNEKYKSDVAQAKQDAAVATSERDNAVKRGDEYKKDYERERDLREAAEKLKIPKKPNPVVSILSNRSVSEAIVELLRKLLHRK